MKILAIESSAKVSGCSILEDDKILIEINLNDKLEHSKTLMPIIDKALKIANLSISQMDYIAVTNGPGSFTGLRIGMATAKGLAKGINKPLVGVSTLESLAYNTLVDGYICPIMDARRNQVYSAVYKCDGCNISTILDAGAYSIDYICNYLSNYNNVYILGDGVKVYKNLLDECLKNVVYVGANNNIQRSASVAVVAKRMIESNKDYSVDIEYLRKSQAEREREDGTSKTC